MRRFSSFLQLLFFGLLLQLHVVAEPARPPRPNIVLILADDLGYGDVGCFGAKDIRTPNLDQMAKEGMRLTNFYVAQPVCTASRSALLTGCYSNRIGMVGALNHTSLTGIHEEEKLLCSLLTDRGYATGSFGKWHLGQQSTFWAFNRGFTEVSGLPYSNDNGPLHPIIRGLPPLPWKEGESVSELDPDQSQFTRRITDRAVKFIEAHRQEPFFLYVPHVMPHVPIFASEAFKGKSKRGTYGDVVEELDASVGEILHALKQNGVDDNTLVIFTSDNGPFLSYGEHAGSAAPFRGGKLTTFEGGVRMPFIIRWPAKVPAGRTEDALFTAMDLYPTLSNFCQATLPKIKLDGMDLGSLLLGLKDAPRREAFWYYSGQELQAVRVGKWKLHLPHEYLEVAGAPGKGGKPSNYENMKPMAIEESGIRGIASRHGYRVESLPLSLYDLEADPSETLNKAQDFPHEVERLMREVKKARQELGDTLTGERGSGVRPVGDVRPKLEPNVQRIPDLEYAKRPTGPLRLDLYLPEKASAGGTPLVVWIHGGGWLFGSKEEHCVLPWLAAEGIGVASINYRLLHEAQWPAQLEDCREAIAWLRTHAAEYGVNASKIAVAGASAGGHLAAVLGTPLPSDRHLPRVLGVIDFFGPTDLLSLPSNVPKPGRTDAQLARTNGARLVGGIVRDHPEAAKNASAFHRASSESVPFLILHGDKDPLVPLDQSLRLHEALRSAGTSSELLQILGAGHGGKPFETDAVRERIRAFLRRNFEEPEKRR
jgi:arylsulfatase